MPEADRRRQQRATVFLSEANFETLDSELNKNFNMTVSDLKDSGDNRHVYQVRMSLRNGRSNSPRFGVNIGSRSALAKRASASGSTSLT